MYAQTQRLQSHVAHTLPQFLEYAAAIAPYLDMGMSLNVPKCAYATTTKISAVMVCLDPDNEVSPWVRLDAKGSVLYLGLRLDLMGCKQTQTCSHTAHAEAPLTACPRSHLRIAHLSGNANAHRNRFSFGTNMGNKKSRTKARCVRVAIACANPASAMAT